METKTKPPEFKGDPLVAGEMTTVVLPHEGGEVIFDCDYTGSDAYQNVAREIWSRGQKVPTGDQTASLVHMVYCIPDSEIEPKFRHTRHMMISRDLWVFNRNLWTPEGVYVVQDLEAIGRSQKLETSELEKQLKGGKEVSGIRFSKDGRVRFAPKGLYQLREHTPESLAKDGFIIASYGIEGAEKLREVFTKFRYKPKIWGVEVQEGQRPELRVSALIRVRSLTRFHGLDVYGCDFNWGDRGDDENRYAFGVLN